MSESGDRRAGRYLRPVRLLTVAVLKARLRRKLHSGMSWGDMLHGPLVLYPIHSSMFSCGIHPVVWAYPPPRKPKPFSAFEKVPGSIGKLVSKDPFWGAHRSLAAGIRK